MSYITIKEYNTYLVENQVNINIIEYVKEVNKLEFKIDISFIDEFIELVSKNECCIHHNMLQKYGISNLKGTTNDIKKLLEQNEFIEKEDFDLRNVSQVRSQGGTVIKNEYYLHPRAFKICLIRSLKTKKYAKYYLLLEECIKYFNDYQDKLKEKYIIKLKDKHKENKILIKEKDNKIDSLEEKLNTIIKNNEELLKSNEELLKYSRKAEKNNRKLEQKLDDTNDNLIDIKDELTESNKKLGYACKKLDIAVEDRVPKTEEHDKFESIAILKCTKKKALFRYYCIRGQLYHVNKRIKKKTTEEKYEELIRIDDVSHSVNIWNRLKEKLKKKVEYCGNEMNLIDINENDFIDTIKLVYDKRKEILISENNEDTSDSE